MSTGERELTDAECDAIFARDGWHGWPGNFSVLQQGLMRDVCRMTWQAAIAAQPERPPDLWISHDPRIAAHFTASLDEKVGAVRYVPCAKWPNRCICWSLRHCVDAAAQPERAREPVAWIYPDDLEFLREDGEATVYAEKQLFVIMPEPVATPLYAAPVALPDGPPR